MGTTDRHDHQRWSRSNSKGCRDCHCHLRNFSKRYPLESSSERECFSWAQGYMSGILMRAPAGEDENLNLISSTFPVRLQLQFFRDYCATRPQETYAAAAEELYRKFTVVAAQPMKAGNIVTICARPWAPTIVINQAAISLVPSELSIFLRRQFPFLLSYDASECMNTR